MMLVKRHKRKRLKNARAHGLTFFIEEIVGYCDRDSRFARVTYRPDGLKKWAVRMEVISLQDKRKPLVGVGDTMRDAFEKAIEGDEPHTLVEVSSKNSWED